jgi:hypothetical protein
MLLSHTAGTTQSSYFGFTPDRKNLPTVVEILSSAPIAETKPVVVNSAPAFDLEKKPCFHRRGTAGLMIKLL